MFEGIGELIKTLFEGLDLRRRWLAIFGFGIVIVFCLLLFEQMTGTIYYNNLGRKIELLKELNTLEKEGNISSNPELKAIFDATVQELNLRSVQPFRFPAVVLVSSVVLWKIASGAALGTLVAIISLRQKETNAAYGAAAFGFLGGLIGGVLPVIYNPWINYLGFPIVQVLFLLLVSRGQRRKPSA